MIEVFHENNYNRMVEYASKLNLQVDIHSECMVLCEGGECCAICTWTKAGNIAYIKCVVSNADYDSYFDMVFRSSLNYLMDNVENIVVPYDNQYYQQFGFTKKDKQMIVKATDIVFACQCH